MPEHQQEQRLRPRWQLAALAAAFLALALVAGFTGMRQLWFIDEEIYFGHGVRIVQNARVGWQVDCWNPPLSYLVHGSVLLVHPLTPDLRGPVVQDPDLPGGEAMIPGKKNPVIHDSSNWQIRQAVEAAGARFDRYAFWARLPLALTGVVWLAMLWRTLVLLRVDPLPGTALLAVSHVFVIEQVRILADAVAAGCVLFATWRALELARRPSPGNGVLLGVAFGLATGAKLSVLPVLPALLLALPAWREHFAPVSPPLLAGWLRQARVLVAPLLLAAITSFIVLWSLYGFQVGSLEQTYRHQRPLAMTPPGFITARPEISRAPIPMPSFLIALAVNRDTANAGLQVKIDGQSDVPWPRKLAHYSSRLLAHVGLALLPLALVAGACALGTRRCRWLVTGFLIVAAAYMAALWLQNLELFSRRAVLLTNLAALVAALAWRETATPLERRVRGPLLALHVMVSLVQYVIFVTSAESSPAPLDGITGLR